MLLTNRPAANIRLRLTFLPKFMRRTIWLPCLALLTIAATVALPVADASARQQNILFLLADDLRWNALGCLGDQIAQTPHLNSLAQQGVLFRNHFVTTSICAVSRASIFSGQYERRHGIDDFAKSFSRAAWSNTYPARLRAAGYRTGFIGKFGVGDQMPRNAFDFWRGFPGQGAYFKKGETNHLTHLMGEDALVFLRGARSGQPFCLSVSFKAPHCQDGATRQFPPDFRDESLYADDLVPVPRTATEALFGRLPPFAQDSELRRRWERRFATPEMFQRTMKDYYRLISGIDREVGRMLAALRELGLAENTLVVFTSDNGFFFGERGLAGKWLMYEESLRVPLIVFDPSLAAGQRGRKVEVMTLNIDLAPTLLDAAGVTIPPEMQGRSLRPLVAGGSAPWREEFFYEHHTVAKIIPPMEGVRTKRWAYLRYIAPNPVVEELYDLSVDPLEENNLAQDAAYATRLADLRARWWQYRRELR